MKFVFVILCAIALFLLVWANKIRIYLKWERQKKENLRPFYRWPASIHNELEQADRLRLAREEEFQIEYQDKKKGLARIQASSDPAVYWCNFGMCQCPDFKKRHKPCKHIYKIAIEQGLIK